MSGNENTLERKEESMEDLRKELVMDEHKISEEALMEKFTSSATQGLTNELAAERLISLGRNQLTPPPETPEWIKFLLTFTNFFSLLLLGGSILSFIGYALEPSTPDNMYIGSVLLFVVIATGIFSYKQERQASDIMKKFKNMLPPETTVVRSGESQTIDAAELVVGDVIHLKAGDAVPADIRMLSGRSVQVDNSSLTGEAEPQSRIPEFTHENPLETKNLCFYGTAVERGNLIGMVVNTGDHTVIGRIAKVASSSAEEDTPIHQEIERFVLIISGVAGFLGITFLILGLILGQEPIEMLVFTIGIIVANVPEGLLATVTVSLTLTAKRMAEKNVLVKNLESVETLGSTTLIASDKTGTLTQNRMTASHVFYNLDIAQCKTSVVSATFDKEDPTFQALQRIATLCNKTVFEKKDLDLPVIDRRCIGDASETALLKFVEPLRSAAQFRECNELIAELPFNSGNKFMATIHKQEDTSDNRHLLAMKGAPERVLARCSTMLVNGEELAMDDELRAKVLEGVNTLGRMGERVLGFCDFLLPEADFPDGFAYDCDKINFPLEGCRFVGLISLIDPPRPSVPEAVSKCQRAGIRVMMVTGDYPVTAAAIAKQVGILTEPTAEDIAFRDGIEVSEVDTTNVNSIVIHGSQIPDFTDEDWDRVLDHQEVVFARTSPQQKLLIVENNQRRGAIVAVTGDGVNDSPALKKANIGVAMGISGSDVSKEAANMILLDDNFSSIVKGVEEGRLIFDNLKKSIAYTLSSNIPEITPFLAFIVTGMPPALSTVLILAVDLGTDMIPAISLAYERAESDIMKRPPRTSEDNLVTTKLISFSYLQIGVIQALAGFFTFFVVWATHGVGPWVLPKNGVSSIWDESNVMLHGIGLNQRANILAQAQTAFFISIIVVQYADLLICKTRMLSIRQQGMTNRMLSFGLLSETILGLFVVYVPFMNTVLGTRPLKFVHFLPGIPWSMLIFSYDEVRKAIIRKNPNGWIARNTRW